MNYEKPVTQNNNVNQVILQARIRVSQSGIEMLDFIIPLGMMELHCSCPIPDEGTDGSPVYVHIKPARQREPRDLVGPRPPRRRFNGEKDENGEVENEDWGNRA